MPSWRRWTRRRPRKRARPGCGSDLLNPISRVARIAGTGGAVPSRITQEIPMQRQLGAAIAAACAVVAITSYAEGYGHGVVIDQNASVMGASATTKMVGGAPMYPTKDIIDNAI